MADAWNVAGVILSDLSAIGAGLFVIIVAIGLAIRIVNRLNPS